MIEFAGGGNNYTRFSRETSYVGQWPQIAEFEKPWEFTIQFGQGNAEVSQQGVPLQSEGFSKCEAFVIQKADGLEAYAAHIDGIDLNDRQLDKLKSMSGGKYIGRFIRGSISRDLKTRITNPKVGLFSNVFIKGREIQILEDIVVNTGNYHWALVYRPNSHLLMVQSKLTHMVHEFDLMK